MLPPVLTNLILFERHSSHRSPVYVDGWCTSPTFESAGALKLNAYKMYAQTSSPGAFKSQSKHRSSQLHKPTTNPSTLTPGITSEFDHHHHHYQRHHHQTTMSS